MINMSQLEDIEEVADSTGIPVSVVLKVYDGVSRVIPVSYITGVRKICVCGRKHADEEDRIRHLIQVEENGKLYDSEYLND